MKIDVLDAGYVEFIETWGSDERITVLAVRAGADAGGDVRV